MKLSALMSQDRRSPKQNLQEQQKKSLRQLFTPLIAFAGSIMKFGTLMFHDKSSPAKSQAMSTSSLCL